MLFNNTLYRVLSFDRLQAILESFLAVLERSNVKPFVVFDGLPLPAKEAEREQRTRCLNNFVHSAPIIINKYYVNQVLILIHLIDLNRSRARAKEKAIEHNQKGEKDEANKALSLSGSITYEMTTTFIKVSFAINSITEFSNF